MLPNDNTTLSSDMVSYKIVKTNTRVLQKLYINITLYIKETKFDKIFQRGKTMFKRDTIDKG